MPLRGAVAGILGAALATGGYAGRPPVVIVPGDGSNQLEARIDKPSTVSWLCSKKADWFQLWLDISQLLVSTECWADNIKLVLDETTGESHNNAGVETRVPGFGDTRSLDCLNPTLCSATAVFKSMTDALVADGYVRNATLLGAPYDFRYAPFSKVGKDYQADLKKLIEDAVARTKEPAVLVSHSMGGLQTLNFLADQTQTWKDMHIREWVAISAPFSGANKELRLHASGDSEGVPTVSPLKIREEQRSYETNFWLMPTAKLRSDKPIVTTPSRNYSAQDYQSFFPAIGYKQGLLIYDQVAKLATSDLPAPGVPVRCLYSKGVDTPEMFHYPGSFDEQPQIINGDGDGTVNFESLQLCEHWRGVDGKAFTSKVFDKIDHAGMLKAADVIQEVLSATRTIATRPVVSERLV